MSASAKASASCSVGLKASSKGNAPSTPHAVSMLAFCPTSAATGTPRLAITASAAAAAPSPRLRPSSSLYPVLKYWLCGCVLLQDLSPKN